MARLPLLKMLAARAGAGDVREALTELAHRLRHEPTAAECEEAARIFDHLAASVERARAAGIAPAHPPLSPHGMDVYTAVEELRAAGVPLADSRHRAACAFRLSFSRVKAIHLEYLRATREAREPD
ncbi:MAG TPA: hypothetical protein VF271_02300 [Rhodanobacteraceae bacterium]